MKTRGKTKKPGSNRQVRPGSFVIVSAYQKMS